MPAKATMANARVVEQAADLIEPETVKVARAHISPTMQLQKGPVWVFFGHFYGQQQTCINFCTPIMVKNYAFPSCRSCSVFAQDHVEEERKNDHEIVQE
jgi:hypothetical protein